MAGGNYGPGKPSQGSFIEMLLNGFPEWAASQGIEPPMPRLKTPGTTINTTGTPAANDPSANKLHAMDKGSAYSQVGDNSRTVKKQFPLDRVIVNETTPPGRTMVQSPLGPLDPTVVAQPPLALRGIGTPGDALFPPVANEPTMPQPMPQPVQNVQPAQPQLLPSDMPPPALSGIGSPNVPPSDTLPPAVDPVVASAATQTASPFMDALKMIQMTAPPKLDAPAAPAPPPIRPIESKLMEVLAMGLRNKTPGQVSPLLGLLGKG